MAITDYSSLTDAIKVYAARTDATFTAQIDTFIADAEQRIYNGYGDAIPPLRLQEMEKTTALTFVDGIVPLPDDYLQLKDVFDPRNDGKALTFLPPQAMHGYGVGDPAYYSLVETSIKVAPPYSGEINVHYVAKFPALTALNSQNFIVTNYPNIYLWAALIGAYAFIRDTEEETKATQRFQANISAIKKATRDKTYSGNVGRPQISSGFSGGFDQQ